MLQHPIRLSLLLTGTAAMALAAIPLDIGSAAAEELKAAGTPNQEDVADFLLLAIGDKAYFS